MTKDDKDYKDLGRYVFNEMKAQDGRKPEYVENYQVIIWQKELLKRELIKLQKSLL